MLFNRYFLKEFYRLTNHGLGHCLCWILNRVGCCFQKAILLNSFITEPVGRPNAVELPAHAFQNFLPQTVTVTGIFRRMVGCAIALNCKHIVRTVRNLQSEINSESRAPNLRIDRKAFGTQKIAYLKFKIGVKLLEGTYAHCAFQRNIAIFGKVEVLP